MNMAARRAPRAPHRPNRIGFGMPATILVGKRKEAASGSRSRLVRGDPSRTPDSRGDDVRGAPPRTPSGACGREAGDGGAWGREGTGGGAGAIGPGMNSG